MKLNWKSFLLALLWIGCFLDSRITYFSYMDEISTIIFTFFVVYKGKYKSKEDKCIMTCLWLIAAIGFISNVSSGLIHNYFAIFVDFIWLLKVYVGYVGAKLLLKNNKVRTYFIRGLYTLSTLFIVVSFACGLINLVVDIGMSDGVRYGIRSYCFVIGNSGHYGLMVSACLSIILASSKTGIINKKFLMIMGLICIAFTTKLMPIIVLVVYFILEIVNKKGKVKIYQWAIIGGLLVVAGSNQIDSYVKDLNHPRMRLVTYGFITLKEYFPLGSGFATYGSEMAKRFYSPLYYNYGFNNYYGLSQSQPGALNDNYLAMIAGQFGILGLVLFAVIMFSIFKSIQKTSFQQIEHKNMSLSLFASMVITSFMSGTFKSSTGLLVFMAIALLQSCGGYYGKNNT